MSVKRLAFRPVKDVTRFVTAGCVALLLMVAFLALPARATNQNTTLGDDSQGCSIQWNASSVMDTNLTNDDPNYPGLMVDVDGNPVDYSNGGYIEEISPGLGGSGLFEITHFYTGDQSNGSRVQSWRIPLATDKAMTNISITFSVPQMAGVTPTFDASSTNARMQFWGTPYSNYQWAQRATATNNGDGTWTVTIPQLNRGEGTVFQFNYRFAAPLDDTNQFVASASMTADSVAGTCGYDPTTLPQPTPTPGLNVCQVEYLGRTVWNIRDADITERTKYFNGVASDDQGEVNADGWGLAPNAQAGDVAFLRLYGATKPALENLRYEVQVVQGGAFVPAAPAPVDTPAQGAVQGNGYTTAVTGMSAVVTPTAVTGTVASMPQNSSFSITARLVIDGTTPIVLLHRLVGDRPNCDPTQPPATVTTSVWVDGAQSCTTGTVTQTRTVTTTPFVFDETTFTWQPGTAQVETQTQTRPMTPEESAACEDTGASNPPPSSPPPTSAAPTPGPSQSGTPTAPSPSDIGASSPPPVGRPLPLTGENNGAGWPLAGAALVIVLVAAAIRRRR